MSEVIVSSLSTKEYNPEWIKFCESLKKYNPYKNFWLPFCKEAEGFEAEEFKELEAWLKSNNIALLRPRIAGKSLSGFAWECLNLQGLENPYTKDLMPLFLALMPYEQFLQTKYWKEVRQIVIQRDKCCRLCRALDSLQVHHINYEHRGKEKDHIEDLTLLCNYCHQRFHKKI